MDNFYGEPTLWGLWGRPQRRSAPGSVFFDFPALLCAASCRGWCIGHRPGQLNRSMAQDRDDIPVCAFGVAAAVELRVKTGTVIFDLVQLELVNQLDWRQVAQSIHAFSQTPADHSLAHTGGIA